MRVIGSIVIKEKGKKVSSRIVVTYHDKTAGVYIVDAFKIKMDDILWQMKNKKGKRIKEISSRKFKKGIIFIMSLFEKDDRYIIKSIVKEEWACSSFKLYGLLKFVYDKHTEIPRRMEKVIFDRNIIKRIK